MSSIGDSIQQCLAEARIRKHLRPFGKRKVGGHDQRGSLGPFGDHLKQELGSDVGQRHVADFVEHDHVVAQPACQYSLHRVVLPGFHQLVDQVRSGGESRSSFLPARGHAQARCEVRLTGAAFAHQHHGFGTFDVAAFGQFANLRRRNLSRLVEVELLQRLQPRQFGIAQPLLNRVPVAFFRLHREQRFQIGLVME